MKYLDLEGLQKLWAEIKSALSKKADSKFPIPLIIGTQTAQTGSFTGTSDTITELYDGLTIRYWLPRTGSGNATLDLTLADGTTTGAKSIYLYGTVRLTTHYPAGSCIIMTYRENTAINGSGSYTGWWCDADRDNDNYSLQQYTNNKLIAGETGIYGYNILLGKGDGTAVSCCTSYTTGTSKTCTTVGFRPENIYYYNTATNFTKGRKTSNSVIRQGVTLDFRYSSNCGQTLTTESPLYLKCTYNAEEDLFYLVSDGWYSQTLPTTEDGYVYIYLGQTYSTYQLTLNRDHNVLWYKDGAIREVLRNNPITDLSVSGQILTVTKSDGTTSTLTTQGTSYTHPSTHPASMITGLADVAISGDYNDLSNKPSLFSGSYNDLTDKPTIPSVPTKVSAFTNDAGYLTTHQDISGKADKSSLSTVATSGSYNDLKDTPTIPTIPTKVSAFTNDKNYLVESDLAKVAKSGSYNDLSNKPTIPNVPTNISAFTNDKNYLTEHQDLSEYVKSSNLSKVATSGDYNDLTNKPDLSNIGDGSSSGGGSSVYTGDTQPTDTSKYPIWVDTASDEIEPSEETYATEAFVVSAINKALGEVESGTY